LHLGAGEDLMRHHLLVERIPTIVNKHLVRIMPAKVPHSIRKGRTRGPPEQPIDEISIKGTSMFVESHGTIMSGGYYAQSGPADIAKRS